VTADFKLTKVPIAGADELENGRFYNQILDWLTRFQMQQSKAENSPQ